MSKKESSAEMASIAGEIMGIARAGGPIKHFDAELRQAFPARVDDVVIERFTAIFQPYFDKAERLAASVLGQREKP